MANGGAAPFGGVLREQRYARQLTQAELAERAGLSERAISDLERGLKHPQTATVWMLINALQLAPGDADAFKQAARSHRAKQERPRQTRDELVRHNLPVFLTSFVGREDEIARLQPLLDPNASRARATRLVTLTGAGGCGKTRLALEIARGAAADFPDGVWFADLSSIADATLVPTVVLSTMRGKESVGHTPIESVVRHVRSRKMLLVLDNCEHLVQACAEFVAALVRS